MTRINTIDPSDLTNEWLLAEFRELPRIINELRKHPERLKLKEISKEYTLGQGHIKFFRDKLLYLAKRHKGLIRELSLRGVNFDKTICVDLEDLPVHIKMFACNDWTPTKRDHSILIERLDERFNLRKKSYHITCNGVKSVINCSASYKEYKIKHFNKYL